MESLVLKPLKPNLHLIPDLIALLMFPRNVALIGNLEFSGEHQ